MIVVADTSPLNYLLLLDAIDVLPRLWGTVVVPSEVISELRAPESHAAVREWATRTPAWVRVISPAGSLPNLDLGRGESAAIQVALELQTVDPAVRLLIDDKDGRVAAERLGLSTRGTLAVLVDASLAGLIDLSEAFTRLRATSFHAPQSLYDDLLRRAREERP